MLSKENARLRRAVKGSRTRREASDALLAKLRATGKSLSKSLRGAGAELRRALRRSRRQKATIRSLSRENARLRKRAKASRNRIETLEVQLARFRATGAVLSRALFGRKSEKQETPRSGRPRGQQRGAPGHGRTQRPGLEERTEELKPPEEARVCSCCGKAYVANGVDESTLVEIEVKAYKRVIRRPRWRQACGCASSPIEVSAPPAPRLFPRTLYGTSFWARFLFEHCACFRPLHRVAAWMSGQGLPISPGTLANSLKRFVPLFEPVADAILAHQNEAALRHADETGWRVQALRGEDRSVGSGTGAPMLGSGGCPIAFALDLSPAPVTTFPAPASSNRTSGFPASGFPVAFIPRFMGPNEPGALSAADSEPGTVRTARADHRATAYSTSSSHIPDVRAVASGVAVSSSRPNP